MPLVDIQAVMLTNQWHEGSLHSSAPCVPSSLCACHIAIASSLDCSSTAAASCTQPLFAAQEYIAGSLRPLSACSIQCNVFRTSSQKPGPSCSGDVELCCSSSASDRRIICSNWGHIAD
jgi:hypothetical protein